MRDQIGAAGRREADRNDLDELREEAREVRVFEQSEKSPVRRVRPTRPTASGKLKAPAARNCDETAEIRGRDGARRGSGAAGPPTRIHHSNGG